jgi:hypothetical protein
MARECWVLINGFIVPMASPTFGVKLSIVVFGGVGHIMLGSVFVHLGGLTWRIPG